MESSNLNCCLKLFQTSAKVVTARNQEVGVTMEKGLEELLCLIGLAIRFSNSIDMLLNESEQLADGEGLVSR